MEICEAILKLHRAGKMGGQGQQGSLFGHVARQKSSHGRNHNNGSTHTASSRMKHHQHGPVFLQNGISGFLVQTDVATFLPRPERD